MNQKPSFILHVVIKPSEQEEQKKDLIAMIKKYCEEFLTMTNVPFNSSIGPLYVHRQRNGKGANQSKSTQVVNLTCRIPITFDISQFLEELALSACRVEPQYGVEVLATIET